MSSTKFSINLNKFNQKRHHAVNTDMKQQRPERSLSKLSINNVQVNYKEEFIPAISRTVISSSPVPMLSSKEEHFSTNRSSITRLKKLLSLEEFSIAAKDDDKTPRHKSKRVLLKHHKKKASSPPLIKESSLPAHRADYTPIVSQMMIIKKLNTEILSKESAPDRVQNSSSLSNEPLPELLGANVMKVIIKTK